jgi:20S proteasome alpha/beta subunit
MTIALGFHASDGVILCADMQKTIGEMKSYDGKVDLFIYPQAGVIIAIAGAGNDDYIQTAKSYVLDGFSRRRSWPALEKGLKNRLLSFFDTHLSRWANFPIMERPTAELLIGVTGDEMPTALFHYEGTSFSRVQTKAKAIGLGVLLAQDLLDRYEHCTVLTSSEAASLGTYILSKVKRGVESCGGPTHIVGLRKGMDFAFTAKKEIEKLEEELLNDEEDANKRFVETIRNRPLPLSWQSEHRKK